MFWGCHFSSQSCWIVFVDVLACSEAAGKRALLRVWQRAWWLAKLVELRSLGPQHKDWGTQVGSRCITHATSRPPYT